MAIAVVAAAARGAVAALVARVADTRPVGGAALAVPAAVVGALGVQGIFAVDPDVPWVAHAPLVVGAVAVAGAVRGNARRGAGCAVARPRLLERRALLPTVRGLL